MPASLRNYSAPPHNSHPRLLSSSKQFYPFRLFCRPAPLSLPSPLSLPYSLPPPLIKPLKPAASPKLLMKSLPQIKRARSPEPFIALSRPGDSPLMPAQNSMDRDALNLPAEKAPAVSAAFLHMVKRLVRAFVDGRPVFNVVREGNTDTQRDFRHRVITLS